MSSHMMTIIYEKLHQNLRGAVHLLGERRQNDPYVLMFIRSVLSTKAIAKEMVSHFRAPKVSEFNTSVIETINY